MPDRQNIEPISRWFSAFRSSPEGSSYDADSYVTLRPLRARAGSFRRPAPKDSTGLPEALADWMANKRAG